ncbi:MAG: MFS transporter [Promethearchaeia archaeon]
MNAENKDKKWRFWPILLLAFFYPVNNALISIAIPIYFYGIHIEVFLIGFLTAGTAISYCFSPILLYKLSKKLGRKKSVEISMGLTTFAQFIYYITLHPIIFLFSRIFEGFSIGMFWTNLQSSISDNVLHDHTKMMSRYNISWNAGLLGGYLIGAIFLFIINDIVLIFYIAPLFVVLNFIIAIMFFQEPEKINLKKGLELKKNLSLESKNLNRNDLKLANLNLIPILPVIIVFIFTLSKGAPLFLYPILSEILGFQSFTVYIQTFFCVLFQLIGTGIAAFFSLKYLKRLPIFCILVLGICIFFFSMTKQFIDFFILFIILGFFSGLMYGFSLKFIMALNMKQNTSKYANMLESVIGIGFFSVQIMCGFLASLGIDIAFIITSCIIIFAIIPTLYYLYKL